MTNRKTNDSTEEPPRPSVVQQMDARANGLHPMQVMIGEIDETGTFVPDSECGGLNFHVFASTVPRMGDFLRLENGKMGVVRHVMFQAMKEGQTGYNALYPVLLVGFRED